MTDLLQKNIDYNNITITAETCDKWIDALRSGKYKQGKGNLKKHIVNDEYSYCCLGVLADIERKLISFKTPFGREEWGISRPDQSVPKDEEIGLPYSIMETLWEMNDGGVGLYSGKAYSFEEIADYIEKEIRPFCKETNTND